MFRTLTFHKDNWSGEMGSLTYDPDKPLHFTIGGMREVKFWLEPAPWDCDEETAEVLGERFILRGSDWPADFPLGTITAENGTFAALTETMKQGVIAQSMDYERECASPKFNNGEKLMVAAAKIIFHTV